ncbi:MAG: serine/threonine protein phosphatase [Clostridiales bacterium]|nr:serine/threonine protein phosphatase [Clostridiales bacterium]
MKLREWLRGERAPAAVQIPRGRDRPWAEPLLGSAHRGLYENIRQQIPLVDAALDRLVRLLGEFDIRCENEEVRAELERLCRELPTGAGTAGLRGFLERYLDDLLTYGSAVGEILPAADGRGVAAVVNCPGESLLVRPGDTPDRVRFFPAEHGVSGREVACPELILFSALHPRAGEVAGRSLLAGLPFVSDLLMKVYTSMGSNFERAGSLRYAVTYRPEPGERVNTREVAETMAREWSAAMQGGSESISDFVAVGNVDIRVIGADSPIPDTQVPVRQLLEQIVAKLGVPPFLLGLQWSTTERMSSQQADLLTSEMEHYRSILTPVVHRILATHLRLMGRETAFAIDWQNISLQDESELANARYANARAEQIEREVAEHGPKQH